MAEDMFLRLGDIEGEAEDEGDHAGTIKVQAWSFGATQAATSQESAGGGSSAANVRDLEVVKYVDKASPNLFAFCCAGVHVGNAVLTVRKAGGEQVEYLKINMEEVIVSSYDCGGETGTADQIKERITLNCARIQIEYKPQDVGGPGGAALTGGWDMRIKKNWPRLS